MSYGPQLPQHLKSKNSSDSNSDDELEQSYGPKLPSTACRGPDPRRQELSDYGPKLPSKPPCLGPQKPEMSTSSYSIGPQIPCSSHEAKAESSSEDDDDNTIGPMLPGTISQTEAKREEAAVQRMQDKLDGMSKVDEPKRESWMTELPQLKAKKFGLGPRSFSKSTNPKTKQDKSWTETPEERARREAGLSKNDDDDAAHEQDDDVLEYMASLKRDSEMEKASKELNKKRGTESLLDRHSKKLKQKEKEDKKPKERRSFDRDVDLQANRFDEARKKAMIKKASNLDSRFSHGEKKFI